MNLYEEIAATISACEARVFYLTHCFRYSESPLIPMNFKSLTHEQKCKVFNKEQFLLDKSLWPSLWDRLPSDVLSSDLMSTKEAIKSILQCMHVSGQLLVQPADAALSPLIWSGGDRTKGP